MPLDEAGRSIDLTSADPNSGVDFRLRRRHWKLNGAVPTITVLGGIYALKESKIPAAYAALPWADVLRQRKPSPALASA